MQNPERECWGEDAGIAEVEGAWMSVLEGARRGRAGGGWSRDAMAASVLPSLPLGLADDDEEWEDEDDAFDDDEDEDEDDEYFPDDEEDFEEEDDEDFEEV